MLFLQLFPQFVFIKFKRRQSPPLGPYTMVLKIIHLMKLERRQYYLCKLIWFHIIPSPLAISLLYLVRLSDLRLSSNNSFPKISLLTCSDEIRPEVIEALNSFLIKMGLNKTKIKCFWDRFDSMTFVEMARQDPIKSASADKYRKRFKRIIIQLDSHSSEFKEILLGNFGLSLSHIFWRIVFSFKMLFLMLFIENVF